MKVLIAAITVTTIRVTVGSALPALAVSGPSWKQLLIVRESESVRTGSAQFRRPTRLAAADAVQPPHGDDIVIR